MEAAKKETQCEQCGEPLTIDFETADFSVQIARVNGKTDERRTFYIQCPHCKKITTTDSSDKAEWGNRKGPSIKKAMFGVSLGCIGFIALAAVVLYFAGQGVVTLFDWIFN